MKDDPKHAAPCRDSKNNKKNNKALWVAIFAVIVVILLVCLFFFVLKTPADVDNTDGKDKEDVASVTDVLDNVVVSGDESETVTQETNLPGDDVRPTETVIVVDNAEKSTNTVTDRNDTHVATNVTEDEHSKVEDYAYDEPIPMAMVEQKPMFPGGLRALYEWLGKNFVYPDACARRKIEGKILSEFVVERDGSVTNVRITGHSSYTEFDEEVLRVLNLMPNWTAGRHHGEDVRVTYILPVTFRLKRPDM